VTATLVVLELGASPGRFRHCMSGRAAGV